MTTHEPRSWPMFAGVRQGPHGPEFADFFHDPRGVHMSGYDQAHEVTLVEDETGHLLGWLDNPEREHADPHVAMVQHERIFEVQFPYGSASSVERGKGTVVRLRVKEGHRDG